MLKIPFQIIKNLAKCECKMQTELHTYILFFDPETTGPGTV